MVRALGCTRDNYFEIGRDSGQKQKGPPAESGGPLKPHLQNVGVSDDVSGADACAGASLSARLRVRRFGAFALLGLAVLALVLRADELSVNEDMVALVERVRDGLAEAVERDDAVPLGFGLPLVVRVLPRLLRRDGQHGEIRAVAADLPLLRVFPEEADELKFGSLWVCGNY